eukprot:XP_001691686.1 hypothetical protein CHLREDRAFT_145137 [Chlamydomonas reinhardtii]
MQENTGGRTAFTFTPLLKHRTTDAARRITALALDTGAGRIFLGLASGHVEEHQISLKQPHVSDSGSYQGASAGGGAGAPALGSSTSSSYTRLVAEKRVSKQPPVQRIFWAHDDPWVAAAGQLPAAEDAAGGGAVALATSAAVLVLQPVAADVQARELLKRKRFDAALALIRACRRAGEDWADGALAQAGLLMMQELRCEDALSALEEVGPAAFQPAQLMPLFPQESRSTSGAVATAAAAMTATAAQEAREPAPLVAPAAVGADGGSPGGGDGNGGHWSAAAAAVAAASAAALMAAPERTPPLLCLSKLPWLLSAAPDWALHVLRSRPLPVAEVLALLQGRADGVRWQYLHHLVYTPPPPPPQQQQQQQQSLQPVRRAPSGGSVGSGVLVEVSDAGGGDEDETATVGDGEGGATAAASAGAGERDAAPPAWHLDPSLHTELALELVECIAALLQLLQPPPLLQQHQQQACALAVAASGAAGAGAGGGSTSPFQRAAAQDVAAAALSAWQQQPELAPPLPPLPGGRVPAAGGGHSGDVAAAAAAARGRLSGGAAGAAAGGSSNNNPSAVSGTSGSGSTPATSELAWLATIGAIPAPAAARQLALAIRAAVIAAGGCSDPPPVPTASAASAVATANRGVGNGSGSSSGGNSLALLRALSAGGDGRGIGGVPGLRAVLQHHLYESGMYDADLVLQTARVVVAEETVCRGCQRPLGAKVFYRFPTGVVMCARCARPGGDIQPAPSTAPRQQQHQ